MDGILTIYRKVVSIFAALLLTITAAQAQYFPAGGSGSGSGIVDSGTINQTAYYPATGAEVAGVGPGTAGQVYTSNGALSPPSFQTPGQTVSVRIVTSAGPVTVASTDYLIVIKKTVGAATTVNLPASPATGETHIIKDGKGDAGVNNVTLVPAAGNIDGNSNFVMNSNYASKTLTYNGTEWNIL